MRSAAAGVLLVVAIALEGGSQPGSGQVSQSLPRAVADSVPAAAVPFPLRDVRLLEGPFLDAMLRSQKVLLEIDPDRLLHMFRFTAGLESRARPYGGWEAPEVELRGHSLGHYLSGCALMYASTGDERFKSRADYIVEELAKIQRAMSAKGFNAGYLSAFPEELFDRVDATRLTFTCGKPVRLAVRVRYPSWATRGIELRVNGSRVPVAARPGSYAVVEREWRNGDRIDVRLPMSLHTEFLPDDGGTVALLYGPVVLAGDFGRQGIEESRRYGPSAPQLDRLPPFEVPSFVCGRDSLLSRVKPAKGPLTFQTTGIGRPTDVRLVPFYKVADSRYTVYWKMYSPSDWEKRQSELARRAARTRDIETRTVDSVAIGVDESERLHGYKGEGSTDGTWEGRRWREANGGWLSYDMKIGAGKSLTLVCTYRGSEGRRRAFEVLVDGERIAAEELVNHPSELFEREYVLPESLVRGKERITVRFQARPGATAGSLFDLCVIQQ